MIKNVASLKKMTKNLKVLVSACDFPESGLRILEENFTVLKSPYSSSEDFTENNKWLLKSVPGCSAIVWVWYPPITKEFLDRAGPQLKLIATPFVGYDHCNVPELKARGIKLTNTSKVPSPAVAEIAVILLLAAARRLNENLTQVRSGEWATGFLTGLGLDIRGSTVGMVGLGSIGQAVIKRLAGFDVGKFLYTGRREKPEAKHLNAEYVSLNELLTQSDFVVLAVPLTNDTRHMINEGALLKMKKNAILVNIGRGDLIDHEALYNALKNGTIYSAGLDVMTPEPLPKDHKLLSLPNIFILPHIGSATVRTRSDVAVLVANNVLNGLTGKPLITPVLP